MVHGFLIKHKMYVSWAAYYYEFWRSCDTEDCSNDAENTEINYSLTHIHIENICFTL